MQRKGLMFILCELVEFRFAVDESNSIFIVCNVWGYLEVRCLLMNPCPVDESLSIFVACNSPPVSWVSVARQKNPDASVLAFIV